MKKKTIIAAILTMTLCLLPALNVTFERSVKAQAEIVVQIKGITLPLKTLPIIENGTTLVPLREITEALKAKVTYSESGKGVKIVKIIRNERCAELTIGSKSMKANGKSINLTIAPRTVNSVTMVPLRAITEALGTVVSWDGTKRIISINEPKELPAIGSADKLVELLEDFNANTYYEKGSLTGITNSTTSVEDTPSMEPSPPDDFSKTNIQVNGVDEADWAKTDGRYIYQISNSRVYITDITKPNSPKLSAMLEYTEKDDFMPVELYVDDNKLVVIGQNNTFSNISVYDSNTSAPAVREEAGSVSIEAEDSSKSVSQLDLSKNASIGILPPAYTKSTVKTYIYELGNIGSPKLTRQLEQEGSYLSSRKIDNSLYIVSNKFNYNYSIYDKLANRNTLSSSAKENKKHAAQQLKLNFEPVYSDSAITKKQLTLPLDQIRYFPEPRDSSLMLVGSIDLSEPKQQLNISAYLGAGEAIYASKRHLYVALSNYKAIGDTYEEETKFHKFRLDHGQVVYIGEGSVPGTLLNQFSMDEHDGYFRVALTKGNMWTTGAQGSTNNLYVLDESLATVGKLEGLAPGERIYSARFMGKRAYMVTFRNIDPLFAIDLNKPTAPSLLGQLKIPGYSDYLHPYDDNHLIGFGKDTAEVPTKGSNQGEATAFAQGLKMALFDVTDVNHPKEKFKEVIGDRGTHSELLDNHKALLFSKEKGLLALPVQLHEIKNKENGNEDNLTAYGEYTYQGAYVYKIDLGSGFKLRGRISHLTEEDMKKSGQYSFDYTKSVKRILYAGDTLYTLSEALLKANDIENLNERGSLTYPVLP